MRRKLLAVVLGGAIAGAASALVALATFTDHGATADGGQPSTLLESASGSGGANLATAPSWPGQTGGGSVVVQGGTTPQGSAPSGGGQSGGGDQSGGGGGGGLALTLPGLPAGGVSGSVTATAPTVTTSTSAAVASSDSSSSSTSSAAATSTSTSTTTTTITTHTTSSTQLLCWLLGKLLPC